MRFLQYKKEGLEMSVYKNMFSRVDKLTEERELITESEMRRIIEGYYRDVDLIIDDLKQDKIKEIHTPYAFYCKPKNDGVNNNFNVITASELTKKTQRWYKEFRKAVKQKDCETLDRLYNEITEVEGMEKDIEPSRKDELMDLLRNAKNGIIDVKRQLLI